MDIQVNPLAVRKSITVNAPVARVFRTFTERQNDSWPRGHHIALTAISPSARRMPCILMHFESVRSEPGTQDAADRWIVLNEDDDRLFSAHAGTALSPPRLCPVGGWCHIPPLGTVSLR
jgi:hypothetical protein